MALAYAVYIGLFAFLFFSGLLIAQIDKYNSSHITKKNDQLIFLLLFVVLIYTLFLGLRENTGTDYRVYFNFFSYYDLTKTFYRNHEFLFKFLIEFTSKSKIHFNFIISFFAFTTISSFLYAARFYKSLLPLLLFFFSYFIMLPSINIMRQNTAFCLLFAAMASYIHNKKKLAVFFCLIAFGIHYSVILPLLFIPFMMKKEWFSFWIIPVILRILFLIFAKEIYLSLPSYFDFLLTFDLPNNYETYLKDDHFEKLTRDDSIAMSTFYPYILLSLDILVLYLYKKIKVRNQSFYLVVFYNFYVIGIILQPILNFNISLARVLSYFYLFRLFFYALLIDYFLKKKPFFMCFACSILFLFFLLFIKFIQNKAGGCAPFYFLGM